MTHFELFIAIFRYILIYSLLGTITGIFAATTIMLFSPSSADHIFTNTADSFFLLFQFAGIFLGVIFSIIEYACHKETQKINAERKKYNAKFAVNRAAKKNNSSAEQAKRESKLTAEIIERELKLTTEQHRQAKLTLEREINSQKNRCTSLVISANNHQNIMRQLINRANEHLDIAENEFKEGVFAPFWDEIEKAINEIATYHKQIESINRIAIDHNAMALEKPSIVARSVHRTNLEKHSDAVKQFHLDARIPDVRPTVARMQLIVRKAQKDFQFSSIFEQRKTNKILVVGFSTLGSAINSLSDSISSSLFKLSKTLHSSLDDILDKHNKHGRMG